MQAVINDANTQEERTRHQAVAQHHNDRAFNTLLVERKQPDSHNCHVRDRGIGDQLFHILLHQSNQRRVHNGHHRQAKDQWNKVGTCFREHRQRETQKAVAAHFQ